MRAVVMCDWALRVDEVPAPVPGPGQVLARVLAAGLRAADQDLVDHGAAADSISTSAITTSHDPTPTDDRWPTDRAHLRFDPAEDVVLGQEFCAEVIDIGGEVSNLAPGDVVVSAPIVFDRDGTHSLGRSNIYPGGYCEYIVLNELIALKVPNGTPPASAAFTDPLASGLHAVRKAEIAEDGAAIVVGLGIGGLACVAALRMTTRGPIIGVDTSPSRQAMAEQLGATSTIDPSTHVPNGGGLVAAWRSITDDRPPVVFDATGRPDGLDTAMRIAPNRGTVVLVGGCLEPSTIHSSLAAHKQLTVDFVAGYDPDEFGTALRAIADCAIDAGALTTSTIGLDDVPHELARIAGSDDHARVVVEPTA